MPEGFQDWSGRTFRNVDLSNTRWKETMLVNARFSGLIDGLVVNDMEVAPLIDAEMAGGSPSGAKLPSGRRAPVCERRGPSSRTFGRRPKPEPRRLPAGSMLAGGSRRPVVVRRRTLRHLIMVTDRLDPRSRCSVGPDTSIRSACCRLSSSRSPGSMCAHRRRGPRSWRARAERMAIVRALIEDLAEEELRAARAGRGPCSLHCARCSTRSGTTTGTPTGTSIDCRLSAPSHVLRVRRSRRAVRGRSPASRSTAARPARRASDDRDPALPRPITLLSRGQGVRGPDVAAGAAIGRRRPGAPRG